MSKFMTSDEQGWNTTSNSVLPERTRLRSVGRHSAMKLAEYQYMNILQSMGQAVYVFDLNGHIIYWNRMAQHIFGYTATEALGKTPADLSAGPAYGELANHLLQQAVKGESWSGEFPVRNKNRELFNVACSVVPYRDEYGTVIGVLSVSTDARQFRELRPGLSAPKRSSSDNFGNDLHQPLQTTITSMISNMASKVLPKMRNMVHDGRSSDTYYRDFALSTNDQFIEKPKKDSNGGSKSKSGIHKVLSSKAEAWMGTKRISWPWKEKEKDTSDIRMGHFGWPSLHNEHHEQNIGPQMSSSTSSSIKAPWSWSSSCSASTSGNIDDHYINRFDVDFNNLDVEISWNDLMIGEHIGQVILLTSVYPATLLKNRMAQHIFGYTATEALGKTPADLSAGPAYGELANHLLQQAVKGESWSGEFPVRNKNRELFNVACSVVPYRDEYGTVIGVLSVSTDARQFRELRPGLSAPKRSSSDNFGNDLHQPLQTTITSMISNMASKVLPKMRNMVHDGRSSDTYYRDFALSTNDQFIEKPKKDSNGGSKSKSGIHKVLSSKAEAWMGTKRISWPWKEKEKDTSDIRMGHFGWPSLHNEHHEQNIGPQMSSSTSSSIKAPWSWSSSCSASTSGNIDDHYINRFDVDFNNLDVEISWNDLMIGEHIGQGSCGTAYRALWCGSDVAVKVFTKLQYPGDVILSFRKEVSLMKRLRHPNILLFMGAVTSPQHLCIVTEFLPRGSLFQLLRQNTAKLDWRRQLHIAIDIANGMNYLHHFQPPIIHRDLKSSNVLVDKNWTVKFSYESDTKKLILICLQLNKVGDFGLSRVKRETYLTTKSGRGTPQWMAPEVLRNEQADENYGVVLWEINTGKIPWDDLNWMQANGMNYLHHFQPPIIHRDLKSSNVLVDKNWTVKFSYESDTKKLILICLQLNKVGDFGLSRVKRETYLTTKSGRGTPQWMAPEVLRNEQADENYGVVLWEINTGKIPWDDLNWMQVVGAVGFMNQRLEIPNDVNPEWASLIKSCWSSEPQFRPTFQEILSMLRDLLKKLTILHRDKKIISTLFDI
ncbi:PAS domain-containing protein tyrosine kinase family protein [Artemisia annua]|uniref:non-specific serine/threonine protein kinase n=1 Tax=Artemisia annua TaxID=35608 RepID=A0A2U1PJH7_ARTAN|nr:PAS domain-containing protein tyrosine kinase family protein [Artemisia annua]